MTVAISANPTISGVVLTEQAGPPSTPATGKGKLYVDTAGVLSLVDDAGVVAVVGQQSPTQNVLTNPGLEIWSRGAGPFAAASAYSADGWQAAPGASATISVLRDSANADAGSQYCAAITYTQVAAGVSRYIARLEDVYAQLRGKTVTLAIRVKTATASACRVSIWDSVNLYRYSSYHTGSGAYQTLTVSAPIAAGATGVQASVNLDATAVVYVDSAVLVVGSGAPVLSPLHPAEDLVRCQRYYYEMGGLVAYEQVGALMAFSATSLSGTPRPHPVEMAITPTVTVSSAAHWACYSANGTVTALATLTAGGGLTRRSLNLSGTVAAGLVAGSATFLFANNTTAARISLEANP